MPPMRMAHTTDPKTELHAKLDATLSDVQLFNNQVLVAVYIRPRVTAGGIHLADETRKEDQYQGKVGLVMMKGPLAFLDEGNTRFHGQTVDVNDWIAFRTSDGWPVVINGVHCRILDDVDIKLRIPEPDLVF